MVSLLIIKNISKKFQVDSFFYLFMILSCLTASFKNFYFFLSIIIIHELGHVFIGLILGWELDKIYLYPYGGITKFNEDVNVKLIEELLVLLGGSFFQIIYFFIGYYLYNSNYFNYYNLSILIFNLLPIYPLDGGRILNVLLSYFFSYRCSYFISIFFSFTITFFFIIYFYIRNSAFNIIIMFLVVLINIIVEFRKRNYYFNKFLLERYINIYSFKKIKKISTIKKMMRDRRHIICINNKYYTEKDYLKSLYQ